jgi:ribosomal protein S18 acetylase RimI-like enzyme
MDDEELRRRGWRGMVAFQRLIGRYGPGPAPLERDAFVASAVPKIPSSLINAACPRDDAALEPHLDEIARFYDKTPKWGAWIDAGNADDAEALTQRGLVLDSRPLLMAAPLDAIEAPAPDTPVERATMAEVGHVNDVAYSNPPGMIAAALGEFPNTEVRGYGIRVNDELASVVSIIDVDDDAFVTMVATLPDHRGKHLASTLLAHALHEARTRKLTTTSLQASSLGQGIYARLGYRPLGEVHLYERRPQ